MSIDLNKIDWNAPIKITTDQKRAEQWHKFDEKDKSVPAIKAALGAKRPLLIRGKPGVGKTQLAAAAAYKLKRPLVTKVVDSRTESRDLLWEYDAVMRLVDAQILAAVNANTDQNAKQVEQTLERLKEELAPSKYVRPGPLWWGFNWETAQAQAKLTNTPTPDSTWEHDPQNGCVILIDEIDKAETDVPNGLLEALGSNQFHLLGQTNPVISTGEPPLVIITTNEERILPDAFVRRCLVLHLALPRSDPELITHLVERAKVHFPEQLDQSDSLFLDAAKLLVEDRKSAKQSSSTALPGQAEYLDLIRAVISYDSDPLEQKKTIDELSEFTYKKYKEPDHD